MTPTDPITRLNAALQRRYHIESELGEGGMATVYLADDLKHERSIIEGLEGGDSSESMSRFRPPGPGGPLS